MINGLKDLLTLAGRKFGDGSPAFLCVLIYYIGHILFVAKKHVI